MKELCPGVGVKALLSAVSRCFYSVFVSVHVFVSVPVFAAVYCPDSSILFTCISHLLQHI